MLFCISNLKETQEYSAKPHTARKPLLQIRKPHNRSFTCIPQYHIRSGT